MSNALSNLIKATGWGAIVAEGYVKACQPEELALLEAGKVQEAMDAVEDRKAKVEKDLSPLETLQAKQHVINRAYAIGGISAADRKAASEKAAAEYKAAVQAETEEPTVLEDSE